MAQGNKPVEQFRIGAVVAAVWRNDNGYAVTLRRSYKDRNEQWQDSDQLFPSDLLNAAKVLERAETWIADQ